jgi:hypothetical protein
MPPAPIAARISYAPKRLPTGADMATVCLDPELFATVERHVRSANPDEESLTIRCTTSDSLNRRRIVSSGRASRI